MLTDARPESAWVVFVSYYQQHPASLFGHTLLVFPRGDLDRSSLDLGSLSASFEGDITDLPATTYVPAAFFGGIEGRFLLEPFHVKSRKYANLEHRDLWFFQLPLGTLEIRLLLLHLWELRGARFDYGFVRANCSFQVLAALEAVLPGSELTAQLGRFVSPADTLRVLDERLGLQRVRLLSSPTSRLRHALAEMSEGDRARLHELTEGDWNAATGADASPWLLDTALLYFEVHHPYSLFPGVAATAAEIRATARHRALLKLRSRAGSGASSAPTGLLAAPSAENPLQGHRLSRLTLTFGRAGGYGTFLQAGVRGAFHELEDTPAGFPPGLVLELARVDLRLALETHKVLLGEVIVARVGSLGAGPDREIEVRPSWEISLGAVPVFLTGTTRSGVSPNHAGLSAGLGGAVGNRFIYAFSLLGLKAGALLGERNPFAPLVSLRAGLRISPVERWTSTVQGSCLAVVESPVAARRGCELSVNVALDVSRQVAAIAAGSVSSERRDLAIGFRRYW